MVSSWSQPAWAAWIEMWQENMSSTAHQRSQPAWAAWIEIETNMIIVATVMSQPAWAAWIEIAITTIHGRALAVAARMGCVD